ncbi:MAG TPA: hypothetical protein PLW48_10105 [Alphaproteobacteria bacterium]|nr:hypothetical protein [Rhodospirillaceae bacterium]HRJ67478.1 hypothetical protein [Alphaproteobacteria bacterium]
MQDPRKNKPQNGDAREGFNQASDFTSRVRDAEHSLDGDDDKPAAVINKGVKLPAPQNDDTPAKDKPVTYDFIPYRSHEPRVKPGFDPDMMDDVDYTSAYGDDGDDDEYDDPRMDDPLFRIAERLLPDRPEILNTLDVISNVDLDSLIAAGIIEEEMRGHMPDKQVDRLTAAALLSGAENAFDVLGEVSKKTADLMVDFNMVAVDKPPTPQDFAKLSPDIQRLIIAFDAGDMEELAKGLRSKTAFVPDDEALGEIAHFLAAASQNRSAPATKGDIRLMQRAARAFNEVSSLLPLDIELRMNGETEMAVYNKNALDAPEVRRLKKPGTPKNEPKPPKH